MNRRVVKKIIGAVFFVSSFPCLNSFSLPDKKPSNLVVETIAFGSCAHQSRSQDFWDPILRSKPDLFIFDGDNIYSDTYDMNLMRRKYAQLAVQPGFKELKVTCPILSTWDDHDFGLNDSGGEFPEKKEVQKNFLDFWEVPKSSPRRKQEGVYNSAIFGPKGKRVQVIMLDLRYFRSPLKMLAMRKPNGGRYKANYDKDATLMGEKQWKWLEEQLMKPADIRILGSSIQVVAQDHNWEKWMNFPNERARLFNLIKKTHAEGLIVVSGDRHQAELSKMDAPFGYPLYDITSSGLNMARGEAVYEPNRYRMGDVYFFNNFGLIKIDWKEDPVITLEALDVKGKVQITTTFKLSTLRFSETAEKASTSNTTANAESSTKK